MSRIQPGGEPFFFPGGRIGCLLVHGFTGAPKEMRGLGEHLAREGFTVLGVRLAGHATRPEDLFRARWEDWLASVEDGYHLLDGACDRLVVMGLSLGGILSLLLAARRPVAGVVAMSTPFVVGPPWLPWLRPLLPWLGAVLPTAAKPPPDWRDPGAAADSLEYPRLPVRGLAEVLDVHAQMLRGLPDVRVPALLMCSKGDLIAPPEHAEALHRRLGTSDKQLLVLENSGHVITREPEREQVFSAAATFARRVAEGAPGRVAAQLLALQSKLE